MSITLKIGDAAPDFVLKDGQGNKVALSQFKGKRVALYFYPKDDSPGCTQQACSFKEMEKEYKKRGIVVLGVSPDDEKSHGEFAAKHALTFSLLADTQHEVATLYGVWGKKTIEERTVLGITRTTFLVDEDGKVMGVLSDIDMEKHAGQVLEAFGDRQ